MLLTYEFLVAGCVMLFLGSRAAVRGGAALSRRLGLPPMLIGLLVIPLATAAPELAVALRAVSIGEPVFAAGAVIGSNIFNALLVLGLASLIRPLPTSPRIVFRDGLAFILASGAFFYFGRDGVISRSNGEILLLSLLVLLIVTAAMDWRRATSHCLFARRANGQKDIGTGVAFLLLGLAAVLTFSGAIFLVRGSVVLAESLSIPKETISVSVTALGVALPELYIAIAAVMRRQNAIAVGAILGANIFNILGVIGVTALVQPIALPMNFVSQDLPILAASAVLVVPLLNSDWVLSRIEGALLLSSYCAYLAFMAFRVGLFVPSLLSLH